MYFYCLFDETTGIVCFDAEINLSIFWMTDLALFEIVAKFLQNSVQCVV
jgi:hypothetical protein